ncbi:cation-transporting P-type ATPase [Candidatus Thorarchaeota archaeon]|nr:MAG: cation-transporting P-type ATPase [Candidatus Thorarchaeota archaeon]
MSNQTKSEAVIAEPWNRPQEEVLDKLSVDIEEGLDSKQVEERLEKYGKNRLRRVETRSVGQILLDQLKSLMVLILIVASSFAFFVGDIVEGIAIVAVIGVNTLVGFVTELRAIRSMEALEKIGSVNAKARREGEIHEVPAEDLVPGDIVILESGDIVTADLRLTSTSKLQVDQSILTGESIPVSKSTESVDKDTPTAEQSCMAFKGTAVTRGKGEGITVAVGMATQVGEISSLVEQAEEEITPLERRLNNLGQKLAWVTLAIGALVVVLGLLAGKDLYLMIETGIALAVATVPEGLPLVATLGLARGMLRMARKNALVGRLSAVETLGTTTVICTDKTGTLTENRMTVVELRIDSGEVEVTGRGFDIEGGFKMDDEEIDINENDVLRKLIMVGVLCNDASVDVEKIATEERAIGDPLEVALSIMGLKAGMKRDELIEELPDERMVAFDPEANMMATYHRKDDDYLVAVKGAAGDILGNSSRILTKNGTSRLSKSDKEDWMQYNESLAEEGLRVIALAQKTLKDKKAAPYEDLIFLGLAGMLDPPREDVKDSILSCKEAGVRVVMVTGDHPVTAEKIGRAVGLIEEEEPVIVTGQELQDMTNLDESQKQRLLDARLMARFNPKQKLDLIDLYQSNKDITAMTGDGVNDAPALKKADIGVAMGKRGTQVARESADIVLRDDRFSTIVYAISEGRTIFGNIQKFVSYLLSCNMSEILIVALFAILAVQIPITPLQILFLNLVTDVFPALALGVGEGDSSIMKRNPREPDEPIVDKQRWVLIGGYGILITIVVGLGYWFAIGPLALSVQKASAMLFLTLAFSQVWHTFNMRGKESHFIRNEVTKNKYVWLAIVICVGLLIVPVYTPGLAGILSLVDPELSGWALLLSFSFIPLIVGQIGLLVAKRAKGQE